MAQQEDTPNSIGYPSGRVFLHGDHLGSVSVATDNDRRVVSRQDYTPWGEARAGGVAQTTRDFTGQRRDGTGLLYYGARYYDPVLGRFLSADSIVPGSASGQGGIAISLGWHEQNALRPLTVDFHESSYASSLAQEDAFTQTQGYGFQLSRQQRREAKTEDGPRNPQTLNRYSYVLDNPLRYVDPTGHDAPDGGAGGSDEKEGYGDGDPEGAGGGGGGSGAGYVYIQGTRFLLEAVRAVRDTFSWLTAPTFTISYFRLQNIVTEFFRDDSDQLPGGTAGALYYENITGEIVGDAGYHLQKATEFLRALQKILNGAYADRITLSNQEYDLEGIS